MTREATPIFWPRDLLPHTIPGAKVLMYGYDTHLRHKIVGRPTQKMTLYSIVQDLSASLKAVCCRPTSRPILFVCHSLGGVIVKELMRQAFQSLDPDMHTILHSTIGIIFFGTPHKGAGLRKLLHHVIERLVRLAGISVNDQIINALIPASERLEQLCIEFSKIAIQQKWRIHSFQEAYGSRLLGGGRVSPPSSLSRLYARPLHDYTTRREMTRRTRRLDG